MNLSVLGDRDIMPDPDFYMECLRASYEELYEAAEGLSKPKRATGDGKTSPSGTTKRKAATKSSRKSPGKAAKKAPKKTAKKSAQPSLT